jgi:hypothetical protein
MGIANGRRRSIALPFTAHTHSGHQHWQPFLQRR